MYNYSTTLKNPYYWITSNGVLFNISGDQDKDNCGQHLVTYLPLKEKDGTTDKTQIVKPLQSCYDKHHDLWKNKGNNDVETTVYGDSLNHIECAKVFPHFDVNYTYNDGTEEEPVMKEYTLHYYLQDMVAVGDTYNGTTFTRNNNHLDLESDVTYKVAFENSIKDDIENLIKKGVSTKDIKNSIPHWYFADNINKEFKINGRTMKFVSVTGITQMSENDLTTFFKTTIEDKVKDYANSLLEIEGKKVNSVTLNIQSL